jgi:hypothetical protein
MGTNSLKTIPEESIVFISIVWEPIVWKPIGWEPIVWKLIPSELQFANE